MRSSSALRSASAGWASRLSRVTAAVLLFELCTGLAVTFGPFHPVVQWGLILHTAAGVLALVPLGWYVVRHWDDYAGQTLSDVKLLGYAALIALAFCTLSGLVVTWQALMGTRSTPLWRYSHLVSTLLLVAATAPHIGLAWFRRRGPSSSSQPARWLAYATMATAVGMVTTGGLTLFYSGARYRNEFPAGYSFAWGRERPFAPSLARTSTNGAFDARSLAGSDTCGSKGCHQQIYNEWKPSAHRYAAMDSIFLGIQNVMAKQNGPESTRYCGGCHDPISLFSGTKNIFVENLTSLDGYNEGVSCVACHSIQKTDIRGNANYIISQPREYLWQWSREGTAGAAARNFLIRAWPSQHNRLSKRMYKKPEYCAACHKQFIDQEINRVGWVQLQNQYDNWAASHWNHKGDARQTVECRECHMPLVDSTDPAAGDTSDYNRRAGDRKHRSHRFLAANNFMPALLHLEGADKQVELTNAWLQGRVEIPEIRSKWATGPVVKIRIEAPASVTPGQKFPVRIVLTSNKVGHDYPTGPLDMIQSWVEVRVTDQRGAVVFSSGLRDKRSFLEPGTFLFKAEPVDQYGNLIDRHNLWEMVGVRYRRSLFPGYSDNVEYNVMCPSGGPLLDARKVEAGRDFEITVAHAGAMRIDATLHYRKIDQFLLNYVLGEKPGLTSPVADIASASAAVAVSAASRNERHAESSRH